MSHKTAVYRRRGDAQRSQAHECLWLSVGSFASRLWRLVSCPSRARQCHVIGFSPNRGKQYFYCRGQQVLWRPWRALIELPNPCRSLFL